MPIILIAGAASGLGLAFLTAYARDSSSTIIAIDKEPLPHQLPVKVDEPTARIIQRQVDVTSTASIEKLATSLSDLPIDLVIYSVGIRGLVPAVEASRPDDVAACETLSVMDAETMMRAFQINAVGAFSLLRALLPNLKASGRGKVVVMSSRMGSVGHNTTAGSAYAYRASKAALNAIVRSFSIDVPEVTFVMNHPGRVETQLVKCREEGAISAEESVRGLLPLIERWDTADSGKFYDRFGEPIQW